MRNDFRILCALFLLICTKITFVKNILGNNRTPLNILMNIVMVAISLFFNGLGVYLTIRAKIGVGPWDVLNLGLSKTFGILYGNASIAVSFTILIIDIILKEKIGVAMIIDAIVVGKSVDFFNWLNLVPVPKTLVGSIALMLVGLTIGGYTQYMYMASALGCGPRDTLLVGLKRLTKKIPIGVVSICIMCCVTLVGYILGGPVGIGTLISVFCAGPIMQFAFESMHFDATKVRHQQMFETFRIMFAK